MGLCTCLTKTLPRYNTYMSAAPFDALPDLIFSPKARKAPSLLDERGAFNPNSVFSVVPSIGELGSDDGASFPVGISLSPMGKKAQLIDKAIEQKVLVDDSNVQTVTRKLSDIQTNTDASGDRAADEGAADSRSGSESRSDDESRSESASGDYSEDRSYTGDSASEGGGESAREDAESASRDSESRSESPTLTSPTNRSYDASSGSPSKSDLTSRSATPGDSELPSTTTDPNKEDNGIKEIVDTLPPVAEAIDEDAQSSSRSSASSVSTPEAVAAPQSEDDESSSRDSASSVASPEVAPALIPVARDEEGSPPSDRSASVAVVKVPQVAAATEESSSEDSDSTITDASVMLQKTQKELAVKQPPSPTKDWAQLRMSDYSKRIEGQAEESARMAVVKVPEFAAANKDSSSEDSESSITDASVMLQETKKELAGKQPPSASKDWAQFRMGDYRKRIDGITEKLIPVTDMDSINARIQRELNSARGPGISQPSRFESFEPARNAATPIDDREVSGLSRDLRDARKTIETLRTKVAEESGASDRLEDKIDRIEADLVKMRNDDSRRIELPAINPPTTCYPPIELSQLRSDLYEARRTIADLERTLLEERRTGLKLKSYLQERETMGLPARECCSARAAYCQCQLSGSDRGGWKDRLRREQEKQWTLMMRARSESVRANAPTSDAGN